MTLNLGNICGMLRRLSQNTEKRLVPALKRFQSSSSIIYPASYVPQTSLSRPPWPELPAFDPADEEKRHQAVVQKVKGLIENGEYGRLFAVVHFASRQWKVTNEDLILIENHIDAACGDRIRMEKVFSSTQTLHSDPHTDSHRLLYSSLDRRCKDSGMGFPYFLTSVG